MISRLTLPSPTILPAMRYNMTINEKRQQESKIQAKIIEYLRSQAIYTIKVVAATQAGNPDIIGCYRGKFIAIEVKRPGKNLTPLQESKAEQIKKAGGHFAVAHSLDEAINFLRSIT